MVVHGVREDERAHLRAAFERDGYVLIEGAHSPDEIGRLPAASIGSVESNARVKTDPPRLACGGSERRTGRTGEPSAVPEWDRQQPLGLCPHVITIRCSRPAVVRVNRDTHSLSEEPTVTRPDRAASITAPSRLLTPSLP